MTIYLYKKTHKITGLNYLGKTISKDPYSYTGSGVYWRQHLEEHGYNIETEILRECSTVEELKQWGEYYSNLWNVVESKEWANLIEESGPGGRWSEESKTKLSNTKKIELAKLSSEEKLARMKNSCCAPETYTKDRANNISKALTGLERSETNKLNCQKGSFAHRQSLTVNERQKIYGIKNAGKTWKLINGKRVWIEKETQNY
jgi:hypothetical protein